MRIEHQGEVLRGAQLRGLGLQVENAGIFGAVAERSCRIRLRLLERKTFCGMHRLVGVL